MAVIKCPHCKKLTSSTLNTCTECGADISEAIAALQNHEANDNTLQNAANTENNGVEKKHSGWKSWLHLTPRRIVTLCVLAPFVAGLSYLVYDDICRAQQLEDRAYARLEGTADLLVYEDFIVRFPSSKRIEDVKQRYAQLKVEHEVFFQHASSGDRAQLLKFIGEHPTSPYLTICMNRLDSLDWAVAVEANTIEAYQLYISEHPGGIFISDATDAKNKQTRFIVTPEESSLVRLAMDNFLTAMTSRDATRIDELTKGSLTFCGTEEADGASVIAYYDQHVYKQDVIGVHFQLGGLSINKKNTPGTDALSYNVYSVAAATINRSSVDSAMVVNYNVSAALNPDKRITSINISLKEE